MLQVWVWRRRKNGSQASVAPLDSGSWDGGLRGADLEDGKEAELEVQLTWGECVGHCSPAWA